MLRNFVICSMNFVNHIFTKFYDTQSTKDVEILYHLGNCLDHSDIARAISISATVLVDHL